MSTRSFRHHASLGVCLGLGLLALAGPTQAQPVAPEPSESFAAQPGQDARALSMQEKAWTLPRLIGLRRAFADSKMHETPESRKEIKGKKKPPFWNRMVLIMSAKSIREDL